MFKIEKRAGTLARAGVLTTPHGQIRTPAFIPVGTKATVKALSSEQVRALGAQAVLANTYHLYLQPGSELIAKSGGLSKFMHWEGPTFTDSGGFQVFSLGVAFGKNITKFASEEREHLEEEREDEASEHVKLAKVSEEGVFFRSHIDGSEHFLSPERSMEIQHQIGADILFAFDEFTKPNATAEALRASVERTHRWAKRCLDAHMAARTPQALYGIVQGGRSESLRKQSATELSAMEFDGYGIGGTFTKADLTDALSWVNSILSEEKPRHLLGIGEPEDLFIGVENGIDTFDCVAPTRMGRNGSLYTKKGKINIQNAKFAAELNPVEAECGCYTCTHFSAAYLAHLFRAKEMLAATLASIHNLYFIVTLVSDIRESLVRGGFDQFRSDFMGAYKS